MKTSTLIVTVVFFSFFQIKTIAQSKIVPLYSGEIPNSKKTPPGYLEINDTASGGFTNVSAPAITVFTPKKGTENGIAVIIFPSGGYRLVVDEGGDIAKAFTDKGITAFVLKYRLPSDEIMQDKSMGPLQDAQMAIKLIRMNAKVYNIDTNKIGFVGLSAGGHLASTAATHLNSVVIDNKENTNLRPDFMILVYPVISFTNYKLMPTITRLLGENPSKEALDFFSNEKQVTSTTPPTFILHAGDDKRVAVQHSLMFYEALQNAKIKSELHVLQSGGHGFALEHPTKGDEWLQWCIAWLNENGFETLVKKKNY